MKDSDRLAAAYAILKRYRMGENIMGGRLGPDLSAADFVALKQLTKPKRKKGAK